jgi:uncharacterized membrane protein YccC
MPLSSTVEPSIRPSIWKQAFASALHIEWAHVEPLAAFRCTVGVGVPLVMAQLVHQPAAGVFIAVGAVSAGFGSFQGAYRSRAAIMLFCALGMAVSVFVGSLAGHSTMTATAVAALWGITAGLFVALGPAASFVALQSAVAVLIAAAYPTSLNDAVLRGLLVLGGGLVQIGLVVTLWPLRRFQSERRVVGPVYRSLSDYAAGLSQRDLTAPEPHTLTRVDSLQRDPQPFARSSELLVFRALLDEAERIRASLAALSLSPARHDTDVPHHLSVVLREIAGAVEDGRAPVRLQGAWGALDAAAARLRANGAAIDALLGQLRAASRLATVPAPDELRADAAVHHIRTLPTVRNALMTIAANLSLQSTACRHALRLAAGLAFATAVYRITALPRGYWFPMTTLLVLRPEFRETYVTGITRILGTLAGAGLAPLLVAALGAHPAAVTVLLLAFVWSGYTVFRANYVLFTICITGYVVLLLYLSGVPGPATAKFRALDTMLGGVLALAIYRVWPTWESSHLREVLATEMAALRRDTDRVLGAYVDPARWDPKALQQSRAAARLARSNAEASVERALGEPPASDRFDPQVALSLLAAFRRYVLGALALHAGLQDRPARPRPELAALRDQITISFDRLASALRSGTAPDALPALRDTQLAVQVHADPALAEQTDVLVDSLNTMASLLARNS